jgi:hypothetical protein
MTVKSNLIELNEEKYNDISIAFKKTDIGSTKEQLLMKDIKIIAHEFIEIEEFKKDFSKKIMRNLLNLNFSDFISNPKFYIREGFLKKKLRASNISGLNIISVDGSSVTKNFMNIDISFLKAIVVKYHFYENHNADITYFPDLNGFNYYSIKGNYTNRDENLIQNKISMDMTLMEINLLNNIIESQSNNDIDLIIIDGSIVITPINLLFSHDTEISIKYDNLLKEYHKLYLNCKENGIILIGSIKDTRTSALCNLIRDYIPLLKSHLHDLSDIFKTNYRQVFDYFSDLDFFNRILLKSQRSCIFNCKQEIEKIRDNGIKKEISYYYPLTFYAFYLKSVKYDVPCRIEFFMDANHSIKEASNRADLISSLLLPISGLNEHYGLPIPQIEAHKRAVFKSEEINILYKNLKRTLNQKGLELLEKRRRRRPFK